MSSKTSRRWILALCGAAALAVPAAADNQREPLGWFDLIERVGEGNQPTGLGVIAGHVEAPVSGNYGPDPDDPQFGGKTFVFQSGSTGVSNHANVVGRHYYGDRLNVSPDVPEIHVWEVNNWILAGFLRFGGGPANPPLAVEADLFNNSWIGNAGGSNNEVLRRTDFAVNDQQLIVTAGLGNGAGDLTSNDILLSHAYNILSVGRSDGNHHAGFTLGSVDGPGRMKPEIVAPDSATSWTTGLVSSCVSSLFETARTGDLDDNPNAVRSEVIKAVLMAGTVHFNDWSNNPSPSGPDRGVTFTPLDPVWGSGQANINLSHWILTGLEHDGQTTVPQSGSVPHAGWDLTEIESLESVYYRFEIDEPKDEVSILTTWNRQVADDFGSFQLPNLELELFAIDQDGQLQSLRGDNGLGVFGGGNIASNSGVDNVEHLFIRDLEPGVYALELKRRNDGFGPWDAAVAWFMPPDSATTAELVNFTVDTGVLLDGDIADLAESDNSVVRTRSGFGETFIDLHNMEMAVLAEAPGLNPSAVNLKIESRIDQPSGTAQVRVKNFNTTEFDLVGSFPITDTDSVEMIQGLDGSTYYNANNGRVRVKVKHIVFVPFLAFTFESFIDEVEVTLTN